MNQNIIIIEKKQPKKQHIKRDGRGGIIRITNEAADYIESFLNRPELIDMSVCELASNFIKFAAENTIIKVDEEEVEE